MVASTFKESKDFDWMSKEEGFKCDGRQEEIQVEAERAINDNKSKDETLVVAQRAIMNFLIFI